MTSKFMVGMVAVLFTAALVGCGAKVKAPEDGAGKTVNTGTTDGKQHEGWWCAEHGVPESLCGQCDPKVAAACKANGDWCKKHDRPESQCFVCHPELEAKFAAQYEAKFGRKPPKPDEGSK